LPDLINLTGSKDKAKGILSVVEVISDYAHFRSIVDLGFQVHHSEFDFDKVMVFTWIKEALENGRKT
jgi:hypothetical protein